MAKKQKLYSKKKNKFTTCITSIAIGTGIVTGILFVSLLIMNIHIYRDSKSVGQIEKGITLLNEELGNIKTQEEQYKEEIETLQQRLWQYSPIIVPESMEEGKN